MHDCTGMSFNITQITSCHDSSVTSYKDIHSLAMWLLTQTVLHVTDLIVYSERGVCVCMHGVTMKWTWHLFSSSSHGL